jgi:formylglycine-generating enzyme required for sulfatase activity
MEAFVTVPAGRYRLGEPGEERTVELTRVRIGRYPVTAAQFARFGGATVSDVVADHPAVMVTRADAEAFCAWASARLRRPVRLPTGAEWEAAARGADGRPWPWGESFDPELCNCAEAAWGWTVPVTAHPRGAGPTGAEQLAGNVWEWVSDDGDDGWGIVRGGSYLDHAWGLRASRALPADPERATQTTGFRIAIGEEGA